MEQEEFHLERPETSMAQSKFGVLEPKLPSVGVLHPAVTGQHWASITLSRFLLKPAQDKVCLHMNESRSTGCQLTIPAQLILFPLRNDFYAMHFQSHHDILLTKKSSDTKI